MFIKKILFAFTILLAVSTIGFSQDMMKKDEMKKDDSMMMMSFDKNLPTVAVIKADWCGYCKNVDPVMMKIMSEYNGKVNFVMFDVTNDETKAKAAKMAKEYGLTKFYNANKDKTSTVAVIKKNKIKFKTSNNTNHDDYSNAIDKVL